LNQAICGDCVGPQSGTQ